LLFASKALSHFRSYSKQYIPHGRYFVPIGRPPDMQAAIERPLLHLQSSGFRASRHSLVSLRIRLCRMSTAKKLDNHFIANISEASSAAISRWACLLIMQ
jgi:hypothetical protein